MPKGKRRFRNAARLAGMFAKSGGKFKRPKADAGMDQEDLDCFHDGSSDEESDEEEVQGEDVTALEARNNAEREKITALLQQLSEVEKENEKKDKDKPGSARPMTGAQEEQMRKELMALPVKELRSRILAAGCTVPSTTDKAELAGILIKAENASRKGNTDAPSSATEDAPEVATPQQPAVEKVDKKAVNNDLKEAMAEQKRLEALIKKAKADLKAELDRANKAKTERTAGNAGDLRIGSDTPRGGGLTKGGPGSHTQNFGGSAGASDGSGARRGQK